MMTYKGAHATACEWVNEQTMAAVINKLEKDLMMEELENYPGGIEALEAAVLENQANFGEVAITDEEVAEGLAAQAASAAKPYDPMQNETVDKAAEVFGNTIPRVKALAKHLKGGALYRVFKNVMEYPLQEGAPKFQSKVEQELFIMCLAVTHAKSVMIQAMSAARAIEERKRAAEETAAAALIAPVETILNETNMTKLPEEVSNV